MSLGRIETRVGGVISEKQKVGVDLAPEEIPEKPKNTVFLDDSGNWFRPERV